MTSPLHVDVKRIHPAATLPRYGSALAAGADLFACLDEPLTIDARSRAMLPTGIAIALPAGFEAQVRPRSGLAAKHGITVLNAPGTIDADYRGEIKVILVNTSDIAFTIHPNDRVAQIVVAPIVQVEWVTVVSLTDTLRGDAGFGSTGGFSSE